MEFVALPWPLDQPAAASNGGNDMNGRIAEQHGGTQYSPLPLLYSGTASSHPPATQTVKPWRLSKARNPSRSAISRNERSESRKTAKSGQAILDPNAIGRPAGRK